MVQVSDGSRNYSGGIRKPHPRPTFVRWIARSGGR